MSKSRDAVEDIRTIDTVTATANAALPKAGGALTGTVTNFTSTGIDDNATSTKVTVSNTGVAVTGDITLTSAGSIKTQGTDILLGTADTGIRFYDQTSSIYPVNVTSSSDRDNAVDLGHPSVRFKDAYLSGGVYLGGTGAANALDDYEEGTWTPAFGRNGGTQPTPTYGEQVGSYTKVGNMVFLTGDMYISAISIPDNGNLVITGMPFTKGSGHNPTGSFTSTGFNFSKARSQLVWLDGTKLGFLGQAASTGAGAWNWEELAALDGGEALRFAITYQV